MAPHRVDDIDIYSNILYVTENQLKLSRLAHDFLELDKDRPEVCCLVGTSIFFAHRPTKGDKTFRESLFPAVRTREGYQIL